MTLRDYLQRLDEQQELIRIKEPVSKTYDAAAILKKLEPRPVLFENIIESQFRVAGNLFCSKDFFARYFGIQKTEIIPKLSQAIQNRTIPEVVLDAPCQEVVEINPNLDELPLLRHCKLDGGNYISSGITIARHPRYGQNVDFHRAMQISRNELVLRVVRSRHFDRFLKDLGQVDIAICIGNSPNILAAAATSVEIGMDELTIANSLQPLKVVQAHSVDLLVPAEAEFILEGTIYNDRRHAEGPFVDLTETYDVIRNEPVFELKAITHRKDAIWQALLPGALEHKLLMGMPREPTIYNKVNQVVPCVDVNVNPGGCSWLHAIVKIHKTEEEDGMKAIEAAMDGHRSCKHVYIVDDDIDIYNPLEVEWAMATRFQGHRDMVIYPDQPGSSLDPSSDSSTHHTTKIGFDLTKPLITSGKSFEKAAFPEINLEKFLH